MSTRQKKKPTPGASESGLEDDASDASSSPTVSDIDDMTQTQGRSPLQRACDLATVFSEQEGYGGMYGVVDGDVVWVSSDGRWSETVAFRLDNGDLIVPDKQEINHEPFVTAADLVLEQEGSVTPDVSEVAA